MGIFVSIQTVHANPITRQQALQHAHEFLQRRGMNLQQAPLRHVPAFKGGESTAEKAPYYVFNIGSDNGFVIAAGDDCAYEILGYADEGHFDADSIPDGMKYMLDFYAEQISYASKSPKVAKPKSTPSYPAVEAMLTTKWGQGAPYNDNCPIDESSGKRCVTGCVATAMAQLMYYHRNHHSTSEIVNDIPSYINNENGMRVDGIPKGSPIDWDNMLDTYNSNATDVQRQAVANLMLYCGVSVEMEYGPSSSGAYDSRVRNALIRYFDYDEYISYSERNNYSDTEWETMVYEELAKGNPLLYCGGRHAFVVDGHDGNGYVHINWGWNGWFDNFFRMTATYPGEETMNGYSSGQLAFFGAVPSKAVPRLTTTELTLTSSSLIENLSSLTSIPVSFEMTLANLTDETHTFEHAVGLYKLGKLQSVVTPISTFNEMAPGEMHELSVSIELDASLAPGAYTLVPINRLTGANKWRTNGNTDKIVTMSIYGDAAHLTDGVPEEEGDIITFACDEARRVCVQYWDINGDRALSKEEAAAVTTLGMHFWNNKNLKSFDELQYFTGLTQIQDSEFRWCDSLSSVIIPPNVTSIGEDAFTRCKLQQVVIPKSVTSIGKGAFAANGRLKDVFVENGNPVYDSRYDCHAIIETESNKLILGGSNSVIPEDVVTIGSYAFNTCKGLESIQIPESVTSIENYAFAYCSNLTSINIPESVTKIGSSAFSGCRSLTEITIPASVTSLANSAFSGCSGLTSVNFLARVNSISSEAFKECTGLTSFTIPSCVTSIEKDAFAGCTGLSTITIPSSVTRIGSGAFSDCTSLTTVTIPNSVTSLDGNPFSGCSNLGSIVVEAGNSRYHSDDNNTAIIETATKTLIVGTANTVIPSEVVAIGINAFYRCSGLTSIVVPEGVTTINTNAFRECRNLTSFTMPNTLTSIGNSAFSGCENLITVVIPPNVTSIGSGAFANCYKLQSINIPSGVTRIEEMTFWLCFELSSVNIPYGVTYIGSNAFCDCKIKTLSIPSTVTCIESFAFQACNDLIEIRSYITDVFQTGKTPFRSCGSVPLYVPKGLVDVYKSTPDWNKLSFIEEMPIILDVNGDGSNDILDITNLIDKLLGSSGGEGYYYDINNDEHVDIFDITTLIDAILGS